MKARKIKQVKKLDSGGVFGATATGALGGASSGMALGPWGAVGGAILGGTMSFMGASSANKAEEKRKKEMEALARANLLAQDTAEFANFAGGNGQGFNINSLYKDGGKTNTPVKSESDDESNLVKASSLIVETDTTTPTDYNTLKLELQKMGLKDYRDVMNADEQTAMKIRSLVRKQVLSNPSMFKSHLSDKDGIKNSINFNTLIPAILPVDKIYGMAGSSGVTETERPKFVLPSTFRDGGKAPSMEEPIGGMAIPVASNATIALGQTHEQGGINIGNNTEVEHGETMLKNNTGGLDVFSSQLGTAKIANPLVIQKGALEKKASLLVSDLNNKLNKLDQAKDKFEKNGIQRQVDGNKIKLDTIQKQIKDIDNQLSELFKQQEMSQGRSENVDSTVMATGGTKRFWDGGKKGKIQAGLEMAAPFLDNISNFMSNEKLKDMDIPKPILNKAVRLDPNVDVSATIAAIDSSAKNATNFVQGNTANSAVARDIAQSIHNNSATQKSKVLEDKNNKETQIKNMNSSNAQQVAMGNNQILNNSAQQQFQKDIQTNITNPSENMANIEGNVKDMINNKNMAAYQEKQLALNMMLAPEGVANDMMPIAKDMSKSDYVKYLKSKGATQDYIDKQIQYVSRVYKFKPE